MNIDDIADRETEYESEPEQFHTERLTGHDKTEWPTRIDHAALDVLYGVALGSANTGGKHAGIIGKENFGSATGTHYTEGLQHLLDKQATANRVLDRITTQYNTETIGELAFRLTELRHTLEHEISNDTSDTEIRDLNHAVEAVVEKLTYETTTPPTQNRNTETDHITPPNNLFRSPESITEAIIDLFSDPNATEYIDPLLGEVESASQNGSLLSLLDKPVMTTELWTHQRDALTTWLDTGRAGYVDMATATGKTVLGISAIAALYGDLHPSDTARIKEKTATPSPFETPHNAGSTDASVLVVAGKELLLEQWQTELDTHLNIPPERTQPAGDDNTMSFTWGTIEYRTAPELRAMDTVSAYDLVILDEAHRYQRGSQSGGWRNVLDDLVESADSLLALSGSIDTDSDGDAAFRRELAAELTQCKEFTVPQARKAGVIADFDWHVAYAFPDTPDAETELATHTTPLNTLYDTDTYTFQTAALNVDDDRLPESFTTVSDLRSFAQSKDGTSLRSSSDTFDEVATAAFTRRPKRWNLSPDQNTLVELINNHAPDQQCIVMVESYVEANQLGETLKAEYSDEFVVVPESNAEAQYKAIQDFRQSDSGILIGPGKVLGTGVDLPNAEVAINVGSGGVNKELVQRIGRVLRNPTGNKDAVFYHVVTIPKTDEARIPGEDGRRLLQRASELYSYGKQLNQPPNFTTQSNSVVSALQQLEREGSHAIDTLPGGVSELTSDAYSEAFLRDIHNNTQTYLSVQTDTPGESRISTLLSYEPGNSTNTDTDSTEIEEIALTEDSEMTNDTSTTAGETDQENTHEHSNKSGQTGTTDLEPVNTEEDTGESSDGDKDAFEATAPEERGDQESALDPDTSSPSTDGSTAEPTDTREPPERSLESRTEETPGSFHGQGEPVEITLTPAVYYLLQDELEASDHPSIDSFADTVIADHLSQTVTGETDDQSSTVTTPSITLPTHLEHVIETDTLADSDTDSIDEFVLAAVRSAAGLRKEPVTVTIQLPYGTYSFAELAVKSDNDCDTVAEIIRTAFEAELLG